MAVLRNSIAVSLLLSFCPLTVFAENLITCGSSNNQHAFCSAVIKGSASLSQNLSKTTCTLNENWGYDKGGIWVDKGCRGIFLISDEKQSKMGKGEVTALAVGGGLLGLAALGMLAKKRKDATAATMPASQEPVNPVNGGQGMPGQFPQIASLQTQVPAWAIGSFRGFNPQYNAWMDLNIFANGQTQASADNKQFNGFLQSNWLTLDGLSYQLFYDAQGIRLSSSSQPKQSVLYTRR